MAVAMNLLEGWRARAAIGSFAPTWTLSVAHLQPPISKHHSVPPQLSISSARNVSTSRQKMISARRETKPASQSLAENYLLKIAKTRHILYVSNRFVNDLRRNLK